MSGFAEFEIWQDGILVAGGSGPRAAIEREARHYEAVYMQDGPTVMVIRNVDESAPEPPQ